MATFGDNRVFVFVGVALAVGKKIFILILNEVLYGTEESALFLKKLMKILCGREVCMWKFYLRRAADFFYVFYTVA